MKLNIVRVLLMVALMLLGMTLLPHETFAASLHAQVHQGMLSQRVMQQNAHHHPHHDIYTPPMYPNTYLPPKIVIINNNHNDNHNDNDNENEIKTKTETTTNCLIGIRMTFLTTLPGAGLVSTVVDPTTSLASVFVNGALVAAGLTVGVGGVITLPDSLGVGGIFGVATITLELTGLTVGKGWFPLTSIGCA